MPVGCAPASVGASTSVAMNARAAGGSSCGAGRAGCVWSSNGAKGGEVDGVKDAGRATGSRGGGSSAGGPGGVSVNVVAVDVVAVDVVLGCVVPVAALGTGASGPGARSSGGGGGRGALVDRWEAGAAASGALPGRVVIALEGSAGESPRSSSVTSGTAVVTQARISVRTMRSTGPHSPAIVTERWSRRPFVSPSTTTAPCFAAMRMRYFDRATTSMPLAVSPAISRTSSIQGVRGETSSDTVAAEATTRDRLSKAGDMGAQPSVQ